jgi:hypothetical protein
MTRRPKFRLYSVARTAARTDPADDPDFAGRNRRSRTHTSLCSVVRVRAHARIDTRTHARTSSSWRASPVVLWWRPPYRCESLRENVWPGSQKFYSLTSTTTASRSCHRICHKTGTQTGGRSRFSAAARRRPSGPEGRRTREILSVSVKIEGSQAPRSL